MEKGFEDFDDGSISADFCVSMTSAKIRRQRPPKNPLWKVQSLLDKLSEQARKMWITGRWVSIDEQTVGFKGKHLMKLRISYKREGDGFQCDAVCDNGYTFSF